MSNIWENARWTIGEARKKIFIDKYKYNKNKKLFGKVVLSFNQEALFQNYMYPSCQVATGIGSVFITSVPGCCGIAVISNIGKYNCSKKLNLGIDIARELDYGSVLYTVTNTQIAINKSLSRSSKWTKISENCVGRSGALISTYEHKLK